MYRSSNLAVVKSVALIAFMLISTMASSGIAPSYMQYGEWTVFHGPGETGSPGQEVGELNHPVAMEVTSAGEQAVVLTQTGQALFFNKRLEGEGWNIQKEFQLPFDHKQMFYLKKSPGKQFLYIGASKDHAIYWAEKKNTSWVLNSTPLIKDKDTLYGLSGMGVSDDGRFLATVSGKTSNLSIYAINSSTGRLISVKSFWADGQQAINGLRGAHSLAFRPDSQEIAVSGHRANSLVFFRYIQSDWQHSETLSNESYGVLKYLHAPGGVSYFNDGRRLVVAMKQSHGIITFKREGKWRYDQLMINPDYYYDQDSSSVTYISGMTFPDKLWLLDDELTVRCRDGLLELKLTDHFTFVEDTLIPFAENPEVSQVMAMSRFGSRSYILASKNHRVSLYRESEISEISSVTGTQPAIRTTEEKGRAMVHKQSLLAVFCLAFFITRYFD